MCQSPEELVKQIHDTGTRVVMALAGGGSGGAFELLSVPGASQTVLEIVVPYSQASMVSYLGGRPDQACSARTARAMAMAAYLRAESFDQSAHPKVGIGCTASLATDRPKRGPHRAHVALQTDSITAACSVKLAKGRRSRREEEEVVSRLLLNVVADACALESRLQAGLLADEPLEASRTVATSNWRDLLAGRVEMVREGLADDSSPGQARAILSGAFNPLHIGHRRMAEIGRRILGRVVEFEVSILNVDKPPLDFLEIQRCVSQFEAKMAVWLTRASTFLEKSARFPGACFLVGTDTLVRIADPRYYGGSQRECRTALEQIAKRGCRFLVFGRDMGDGFVSLQDLALPQILVEICQEVPSHQFREAISSTALRRHGAP
jgi:nicotinamide mononucleotide (NMN) deamidase PncC